MDPVQALGAMPDPLQSEAPEVWDLLIQAVGPASVLLYLERRMGRRLRAAHEPTDLWQETLLHVWRDRGQVEWRGISAFRRWVLSVAENRLRNALDRLDTLKRDGGERSIEGDVGPGGASVPPPVSSTTPSRVATYREEADLMRRALDSLTDELRDVVRLRLLEERTVNETASQLSIGPSAVKHRFRKGAAIYYATLQRLLDTRGA